MKIQVAIARKILVAVWHMLTKQEDFIDRYLKRLKEARMMEKKIKYLECREGVAKLLKNKYTKETVFDC